MEPARQGLNRANTDEGRVNAFSISGKQNKISEGGGGEDEAKYPNVTLFLCVNSLSVFELIPPSLFLFIKMCSSEQGVTAEREFSSLSLFLTKNQILVRVKFFVLWHKMEHKKTV